eukprot:scaffold34055_cov33-Tisochrysis_lutea.AAC.1
MPSSSRDRRATRTSRNPVRYTGTSDSAGSTPLQSLASGRSTRSRTAPDPGPRNGSAVRATCRCVAFPGRPNRLLRNGIVDCRSTDAFGRGAGHHRRSRRQDLRFEQNELIINADCPLPTPSCTLSLLTTSRGYRQLHSKKHIEERNRARKLWK